MAVSLCSKALNGYYVSANANSNYNAYYYCLVIVAATVFLVSLIINAYEYVVASYVVNAVGITSSISPNYAFSRNVSSTRVGYFVASAANCHLVTGLNLAAV